MFSLTYRRIFLGIRLTVHRRKAEVHTYKHTYITRFFTHVLSPKGQQGHFKHTLEMGTFHQIESTKRYTADVTGSKAVAVRPQSISGVSVNFSHFTTSMEERERCYSFALSRTQVAKD
jgi:hypothetical protein